MILTMANERIVVGEETVTVRILESHKNAFTFAETAFYLSVTSGCRAENELW